MVRSACARERVRDSRLKNIIEGLTLELAVEVSVST